MSTGNTFAAAVEKHISLRVRELPTLPRAKAD